MKKYEAVFILDEHGVEEQGRLFADEFTKFAVELGGKIEETLPMGRRQFAYEIKKKKSGIYWDFIFSLEEDKVASIRSKYRLDERVLRMQVFNFEGTLKPPQTQQPVEAAI